MKQNLYSFFFTRGYYAYIQPCNMFIHTYAYTVVELSFRKGRVQTVIMRALCTRIFAARDYEAFFSGPKGHFNIGSFGPV